VPRSSEVTRSRVLNAAYVLFRRKGFSRVGMDEIAAAAKVTKRTLYYHYDSKDALLSAVLNAQHVLALKAFETVKRHLSGGPDQMVGALFSDLAAWSSRPRWAGSGFTRLAVELADLPGHPARVAARRHKAIIESELAKLLGGVGVADPAQRAREVMLLSEGAISLILIHGDQSYAPAAAEAAKLLLAAKSKRPSELKSSKAS
jgi:AcrR family transcriptional regulator